ncbi:MAG: septal ring lytic transglycosylase RlpA family protein [Treponema sp.]|jgi:rare lipoprotein A (peptidoglycan hydrolase)|nr:septal ring lytic transglycosylase RlpA family protein [Treponema sp.]
MKTVYCAAALYILLSIPVAAQDRQNTAREGMASWYESPDTELYASHATYPFGTELIITNLENQRQIIVKVGGRIPEDSRWIVDISPNAAEKLGMNMSGFTRVKIEEVVKTAGKPKAMRATIRKFSQVGLAQVLTDGADLSAGHPSLALGAKVKITNPVNGRQVTLTIKSRIRANSQRVIELSKAAGVSLGMPNKPISVKIESAN